MDLKLLNTAALDEAGVDFVPNHPATGEPLDFAITLRSRNCESVRANARAYFHRLQASKEYRQLGVVDAVQAESTRTEQLVACTVGWKTYADEAHKESAPHLVIDGHAVACDAKAARALWTDPGLSWLRAQALAFTEEGEHFLPKTARPSMSTPSGSSSSAPTTTPTSQTLAP